ncbi:MAG: branched-chain amino acid ABC transporter permease [Micromonosporaceae bacterium]
MMNRIRQLDQTRARYAREVRGRWYAMPRWMRIVGIVAFVALLFYLPYMKHYPFAYLRTDVISGGSDWPSVLFLCAVYVTIAIGLNIVVGLAGLLDLGYVGFFAVGAYSVALFGSPDSYVTTWIQQEYGLSEEWAVAWAVCVPIAIMFTMISGVILGWPTLRLRGDYLAIVTLGFGEIIRITARNATFTGGPQGVINVPAPPGTMPDSAPFTWLFDNPPGTPLFGVVDIKPWYMLAIVALLIFVVAVRRLENSRVGRSWLAIREDEDAAAVMGVPAFKFKLWAFAMGAALGGFSGMLFASRQTGVDPVQFQLNLSILFVAMVVIGGSGNMLGVVMGAVLLTYLPERFREFEGWRPFAFATALIVVMILRPQGMIPSRRRATELEDRKKEAEEVAVSG